MWRLPSALRSCTCTVGSLGALAASKRNTRCEDDDFGFDSDLEKSLKAPGQFEHWDSAVRALTSVNTFGGVKVDISKPLTPNFVVRHSVQLGESPQDPNASAHYSFMAQVFNESGVIVSTLDQNGTLEAQVILPALPFSPSMSSKLVMYFSGQQDMFWHDVEWAGATANAQLRWGSNVMGWKGMMASASYTQAVTPQLSLGAEAGLQMNMTTPVSAAVFKYDRPADTWLGGLKSHAQPLQAAGDDGLAELSVQYHRKVVPERVNVGCSLAMIPKAMHVASSFGAELQLHQSTVSTAFTPSQGRITTSVQSKMQQGINMSLVAEGNFGQQNPQTGETSDAFKFGFGFTVG